MTTCTAEQVINEPATSVTPTWEQVFVDGFAPDLSSEQLTALAEALREDATQLIQGATVSPPPMMCVQDWPVEAADAIGFCGVEANGGFGEATVGDVEKFFARACFEADQRLNCPAACRWFLGWFDETPRHEMRRQLLPVVESNLASRQTVGA